MKTLARLGIAFVAVLAFGAVVRGQAKHRPTLEESLGLKQLGSPHISPDGSLIAYTIRETA